MSPLPFNLYNLITCCIGLTVDFRTNHNAETLINQTSVGEPVSFFHRFSAPNPFKKGLAPGSLEPFYKFILPAPALKKPGSSYGSH